MALQKVKKRKRSVNHELNEILLGFFKYASPEEKRFDIGAPFILSLIIFVVAFFLIGTNKGLLGIISDVNNTSLSIMSILAGFNTASLAVIASTEKETLFKLLSTKGEKNKKNILEQLLTFFSYSIILELLLIIFGSLLLVVLKYAPDLYLKIKIIHSLGAHIILSIGGFVWLGLVLHTLFISIRNVSILYHYIVYVGSNDVNSNEDDISD